MPNSIIHQVTSPTSWRILCLLRLGERKIGYLKPALEMSESAFSHAFKRLRTAGVATYRTTGREKIAKLTKKGQIVFSSLQALCYALNGTDGTSVEDDSAMVAQIRKDLEE